jgi:hypothetical protein
MSPQQERKPTNQNFSTRQFIAPKVGERAQIIDSIRAFLQARFILRLISRPQNTAIHPLILL